MTSIGGDQLGSRHRSLPTHVRRWVLGSTGAVAAVMVLFVATTASNRVVETAELKQMFDIGRESNVPTLVNTVLLVTVAALAAGLALLRRDDRKLRRSVWWVAAIVTLLAVDEATGLHERFGGPAGRWLERVGIDWPTYAWLVPGIAVVCVGGVVSWRVGRHLPRVLGRRLTIAAGIFFAGAIGMEGVNGWLRDRPNRPGYFVGTMVEEILEMMACVYAGVALLRMVAVDASRGRITITAADADREAQRLPRH
ncbi:MAG: hypothetical protein ABJH68_14190 [Ilumatobacter sp.]|uniref:hypothetical protein n=1 Tax=Ilumatobacter sp. TaxID=1967498 RepID=UPI0032994BBC